MTKVLILYSSTDGHTIKICEKLKSVMAQNDHHCRILAIEAVKTEDLAKADKLVVGASIRYGKHHKHLYQFVEQRQDLLANSANAFFSVNAVARKPGRNSLTGNPYVKKFFQQVHWSPTEVAVFAGKIDYRKYKFFDRLIIRLIMKLTGGPTNGNVAHEFTDWQQVEAFAKTLCKMTKPF
jgi:menaquinone-dependent protoporphyrinogen oxidase